MHTLEWVVDLPAVHGTAPIWHPAEGALYWSDSATARLYRYRPDTGSNELILDDGRPVGAITIQTDGSLLLFRDQANIVVWRDGEIHNTIIAAIADFRHTRFTSAATSPAGGVFCSTRSDLRHPGRLLYLDTSGHLHTLADHFGTPAGMAFSPDGDHLYFNDAHATRLTTWRFLHSDSDTPLAEQTPFRDGVVHNDCGAPFGLAVDKAGDLWLSRWDGSALLQCHSDGSVGEQIDLPIRKPTDLVFGGTDYSQLYLTSSGGHRRQFEGQHAGALAAIRIDGVSGSPPAMSRIQLGSEM